MARDITRRAKGNKTAYTKVLTKTLKECHLNGLIEEVLLIVKRGLGTIEAVDLTNSLMVVIRNVQVMSKDITADYGLGDLNLMIKFLTPINDKELSVDDKESERLILRCKDKRKKILYLLTEPDLIPTRTDEDSKIDKLQEIIDSSEEIELTEEPVKDFLSNITLLKTNTVRLYGKEDLVMLECGESTDHLIEIVLSKMTTFNDIEVKLNGDHLARIFNVINFTEESKPKLYFSEGASAVVIENGKSLWALLPMIDED